MLQGTHTGGTGRWIRNGNTWYFSGGEEERTIHTGVAVVIRNELRNYINDVEPISDRMIKLKLKGVVLLTFLGAYAPTALATDATKQSFYKTMREQICKEKNKGLLALNGDFNARILK